MSIGEPNFGKKIEKLPPQKETEDKEAMKASEGLTIKDIIEKRYEKMKEIFRKERQEKGKEYTELLRKKTSEKGKEGKYHVLDELQESAEKYGFGEVLINEKGEKIASVFPNNIISFPEKCFPSFIKIKEFAPDFAKQGMGSVFSHQSQFLKGGAFEMGKELYKEMEEYFSISESIKLMRRWQDELRARGIPIDQKLKEKAEEIISKETERLTKIGESMKRLKKEREVKSWDQDIASAESEEEAVKKIANYLVFLELLYDDSHNIESNLRKESLVPLSSLPKEKEKFGENLISEGKRIKSELIKKYEESKTGPMYG
ncbi:hypothetical protein KJ636_00420 [Patescibacteria group bacterium]|nr:hypothetical protein [Patescibacteria group bacterium]MBU4481618.1 hypothetical protein [Patescibacteria group bacterium]